MTMRTWIISFAILATAIIASAYPGYQWFKNWRAEDMAAEAQALLDKEQIELAVQKASSALTIARANEKVLRTAARAYSAFGLDEGLKTWKELEKQHGLGTSDRREYANALLQFGRFEEAFNTLESILEDTPNVEDYALLQKIALLRKHHAKAAELNEAMIAQFPEHPKAQLLHAQHLLLSENTENDAGILLDQLSHKEDTASEAQKIIANNSDQATNQRIRAAQQLLENNVTDFESQLEAHAILYKLMPEKREERLREILNIKEPIQRKVLVARWLNRTGLYEEALSYLSEADITKRRDLFLIHLDTLAYLKQWARILEYIESPKQILDDFWKQLFRYRAYSELGRSDEAQLALNKAVETGPQQLIRMQHAATYTHKIGNTEDARYIYERMTKNAILAMQGYVGLIKLEHQNQNLQGIITVLQTMREEYPANEAVKNDLNYYTLLNDSQTNAHFQSIIDLYEQTPNMMAYRITLALAFVRNGEYKKADQLLNTQNIEWSKLRASWQFVRLITLYANKAINEANAIYLHLDKDALLPEERNMLQVFKEIAEKQEP